MDIPRPEQRRKKLVKRARVAIAMIVLVGLSAAALVQLEPAAPSVPRSSVWIDSVREGEMLVRLTGPGTLVPREVRWIAAQTDAHVERILVRPGAQVEADTVLMELSNPDLLQELSTAKFELKAAEAALTEVLLKLRNEQLDQRTALAVARAEYQAAQLQVEAEKELNDEGIVPDLQYKRSLLLQEQAKVRMEAVAERLKVFSSSMDAQLEAQRARVEQMRTAYDRRREQVESLHVRAGISGVLQEVLAQEGQRISRGTSIARTARPGELRAELQIPEGQAHDVQLGQDVSVDMRNAVVKGKVVRIDPAVQAGTVKVDVDLLGALPPGARADLSVDGTIEITRLPHATFTGRPALGQSNTTVNLFKLVDEGRYATRVKVKLGRTSTHAAQILEGLAAGDQVILSDSTAWGDHDRIRLVN